MFSETDFGTTKINGVVEKCLLKAVEALDISRDDVSLAAIYETYTTQTNVQDSDGSPTNSQSHKQGNISK